MLKLVRIERVNKVKVLILSDSHDFTTDYISIELKKRGVPYLRLDRDLLNLFSINWEILSNKFVARINDQSFLIEDETLAGVYFRSPTYFRETFRKLEVPENQLKNSQWLSLFRNLQIFNNARWVNSPSSTYHAENKILQLRFAHSIGFLIPETVVTNGNLFNSECKSLIAKSIDTVLFDLGGEEAFCYSNMVSSTELIKYDNSIAPLILQECIEDKVDIRATVIGNTVYASTIKLNNAGVRGDWRLYKKEVRFSPIELPKEIENKCVEVVKLCGLVFAGVDLIESGGKYYFVELNPTGEWAWLVDSCGFAIPERICNELQKDY
jgi:glutathione synthase/RimK-type ligase-like ATP-grasp enzyme